jgi:hypothetical protein
MQTTRQRDISIRQGMYPLIRLDVMSGGALDILLKVVKLGVQAAEVVTVAMEVIALQQHQYLHRDQIETIICGHSCLLLKMTFAT